jgi:hypothetical protein
MCGCDRWDDIRDWRHAGVTLLQGLSDAPVETPTCRDLSKGKSGAPNTAFVKGHHAPTS